jgi:hypothetical protein
MFFNPFTAWDHFVDVCEAAINAVIEPFAEAYWRWEWERICEQNGWQL